MKPGPESNDSGVCLMLLPDDDTPFKDVGEMKDGEYHMTVFYLGDKSELEGDRGDDFVQLCFDILTTATPISAKVAGFGRFNGGDDGDPLIALIDSPEIEALRRQTRDRMLEAGFETTSEHGYTPHITLGYLESDENPPLARFDGGDVTFSKAWISDGESNMIVDLPYEGEEPTTEEKILAFMMKIEAEMEAKVNNPIDKDPDPSPNPGAAKLRRYWTKGPGAAKIRWGTSGDFMRCVRQLEKHVVDPKGLCNVYHTSATGSPPGKGHGGSKSDEIELEEKAHDLVFFEHRSTPKVVNRGGKVTPEKGWGKQTRRRPATAEEEAKIKKGDWVQVDQSGKKPGDSGYRRTGIRPGLLKKVDELVDQIEAKIEASADTVAPAEQLSNPKDD